MTLRTKNLLAAALAVFCILAIAQTSFARSPKWVEARITPSLVVIGKDKNKPGYLGIKVVITHKNISKDGKIITAIYNKKLKLTAKVHAGDIRGHAFSRKLVSSKVNKCEVYPGQSINLNYIIPIDAQSMKALQSNYGGDSWEYTNRELLINAKTPDGFKKSFRDRAWTYDFDVKSSN